MSAIGCVCEVHNERLTRGQKVVSCVAAMAGSQWLARRCVVVGGVHILDLAVQVSHWEGLSSIHFVAFSFHFHPSIHVLTPTP